MLRKFGLTMGAVLGVLALVFYLLDSRSYVYFLVIAVIMALPAIAFPSVLKPVQKIWMALSIVLNWFMTRVLLLLFYYLVLTPFGLIARLFRKRFLELGYRMDVKSYWQRKEGSKKTEDLERQF